MTERNLEPKCASPEYLYEFYASNHKNLTIEDLEFEYEQHGTEFFRKLIKHFVEYHYPETPCLVLREGLPFIRLIKNKRIDLFLNEYMIDYDRLLNKTKKDFKIIVIPFETEFDMQAFTNALACILNIKINIWSGKELSFEVES